MLVLWTLKTFQQVKGFEKFKALCGDLALTNEKKEMAYTQNIRGRPAQRRRARQPSPKVLFILSATGFCKEECELVKVWVIPFSRLKELVHLSINSDPLSVCKYLGYLPVLFLMCLQ